MLRDRSLLALTTAELVSTLGSHFSALVLPWFVLATTHSSTRRGLVFAAELIGARNRRVDELHPRHPLREPRCRS